MKVFPILLLVSATSSSIFAQELPYVNIGTGLTGILNAESSIARAYNISGYNFVVEKPIKIFGEKLIFYLLTPV